MKRLLTTIQLFCCCCASIWNTQSQNLHAPELSFTYACAKDGHNLFEAIVAFDEQPFNTNNTFYIELSDAQGSFDAPTVLKTVTDQNFSFGFETSFQLPTTVRGDNYKIRVRATSPAMVSPSSQSFNAYYIPSVQLVLNNYQDVAVCGGNSATISLNHDIADEYIWYKDGQYYANGGATLEVTESGEYYVEPYFGDCTGTLYSNIVIVSFGEDLEARITGDSVIEACPGVYHTFSANTTNEAYTYKWYKNGEHLSNLPPYMPHLRVNVSEDSYGDYQLKIINEGGCEAASNTVTLTRPENGFTVEAVSATETLLFNDDFTTLSISTNAPNPTIAWYKNGEIIQENGNTSLHVNEPGTYWAQVTAQGSCAGSVKSPEFSVFVPQALSVEITADQLYNPCESSTAELEIASFSAVVNGSTIEIPASEWQKFTFSWIKNNESLSVNRTSLPISSYHDNGLYTLAVNYNNTVYKSNSKEIRLKIPTPELQASKNVVCDGEQSTLTATTIENAVYNWYKNDVLIESTLEANYVVSEPGEYYTEIQLNGCSQQSEIITISPLSDDVVSLSHSGIVYISPEGSETVTASGADRYIWTDSTGITLSTTDSLQVSEEGTYTLTAYVGGCKVIKTITVAISESFVVPNIITPNQDNINDKWVLPAKIVNDPDIEVVICDTYGRPILKTKQYQNNWPEPTTITNTKSTIYYYFINKNGKALKKGSITVVGL